MVIELKSRRTELLLESAQEGNTRTIEEGKVPAIMEGAGLQDNCRHY